MHAVQSLQYKKYLMNFNEDSRQKDNETATFNKLDGDLSENPSSQELFPIEQESMSSPRLDQSITMPKSLIPKTKSNDNSDQFSPKNQADMQSKPKEPIAAQANLTFHPQFAQRLFYKDDSLSKLKAEHTRLKEELISLNVMISDMIDKKNDILNEYEKVVQQRKVYKKLQKNLQEEYEGYLYMLEGDYSLKVDEEYQKEKQNVADLKKKVHALNAELSRPLIKDRYEHNDKMQRLEKELFQMQIFFQKQKDINTKKLEKLSAVQNNIKTKENEIKKMAKAFDRYELQIEQEDIIIDDQNYKNNKAYYDELQIKLTRLKKIKELNEKNREIQFTRKQKDLREKDIALQFLKSNIQEWEQKISEKIIELHEEENMKSTIQSNMKYGNKMPNTSKGQRSTSDYKSQNPGFVKSRQVSITPSLHPNIQKSLNTLNRQSVSRKSIRSFARTLTENNETVEDRPQLQLRNRKIYTQLEKNKYFQNIEQNEIKKLSRLMEFENRKDVNLSSHNIFEYGRQNRDEGYGKKVKLPRIDPNVMSNSSIIDQMEGRQAQPQRKLNKPSIDYHNKQIKASRANKAFNENNYRQLCGQLQRDRLLIEQDCEYELADLIYNSKY